MIAGHQTRNETKELWALGPGMASQWGHLSTLEKTTAFWSETKTRQTDLDV